MKLKEVEPSDRPYSGDRVSETVDASGEKRLHQLKEHLCEIIRNECMSDKEQVTIVNLVRAYMAEHWEKMANDCDSMAEDSMERSKRLRKFIDHTLPQPE